MKKINFPLILLTVYFLLFPTHFLYAGTEGDKKVKEPSIGDEYKPLLEEARSYRHMNLTGPSLERYDELIRRYPQEPLLLKEAGDVHAKSGNFSRAKKLYDEALFIMPYDPDLRLAWSQALQDNKRRKEAVEELKALIAEDPTFVEAYRELANYYSWDKEWQKAAEVYAEILKQLPDDSGALLGKAQMMNYDGNWNDAIPLYEQIVRKEPGNVEAVKDLARLYSWTQQWKKSQELYRELIAAHPEDQKILEELGEVYYYGNNLEAAKRVYNQLSESNPDAARRLNAKFSDVSVLMGPTLIYSFLYYVERNRTGAERRKSESIYNTLEYTHPIRDIFKFIGSITSRHDDIIKKVTTFTYGLGWQTQVLKNLWHRIDWKWEPRNEEVNPRWILRNAVSWRPRERYETTVFHQFNTYWDHNESNTVGFGVSRAFFSKQNVVLSYRFTFDSASHPSSYFVSIKKTPGENLKLVTNTVSLEKYWALFENCNLTTGTSYDVTSEGRNTLTLYGYLGYQVFDRVNIAGGTSWGRDNREIESMSASGNMSLRF